MEIEQRKHIRVPVKLNLEISDIFKQDNVKVEQLNAPIEVVDISRNGIGFQSRSVLPIGFYFNARLEFADSSNALNSVVRIIMAASLWECRLYLITSSRRWRIIIRTRNRPVDVGMPPVSVCPHPFGVAGLGLMPGYQRKIVSFPLAFQW